MKQRKSRGAKTEPRGTPEVTLEKKKDSFLTLSLPADGCF